MIVYKIDEKYYINTTNKCSNSCNFCVRQQGGYEGYDLWLDKEPEINEIISDLSSKLDGNEYVFCGFGEPLYRLDAICAAGRFLKEKGKTVRLNTNGQADLIVGKGMAEKIKDAVDIVSISLNATNADEYQKICACEFGEEGFNSLLRFADECVAAGIRTIFSVVDIIGEEEIKKAAFIADKHRAELRIRELITY